MAALTVTIISAAPVWAAEDIPVNDDISVSGDYDWTRFADDHITLNVYNNGLYISDVLTRASTFCPHSRS